MGLLAGFIYTAIVSLSVHYGYYSAAAALLAIVIWPMDIQTNSKKEKKIMAWKTIQKRVIHKHISRISNIKVLSLENCFVRESIQQIGKLRVHSNLWYEFDYK
jgi:hypothetical protein